MSMLSIPEVWKREMARHITDDMNSLFGAVNKQLKLHLLRQIAVTEFTCPRCKEPPGVRCRRWWSRNWWLFGNRDTPHKERIVAALTVYGD